MTFKHCSTPSRLRSISVLTTASPGCCAGNMIEEIPAQGSLPVWRSDEDSGALALRITEHGRAAIGADQGGEASGPRPIRPSSAVLPNVILPVAWCYCGT